MLLRQTIMAASLLAGVVSGGNSAGAAPLPPGTSILAGDSIAAFAPAGNQRDLAKAEVVTVEGQPFAKALRLVVAPGAKAEWNVQLVAPTVGAIKSGDVLIGHFWMRCAESMTGDGSVGFILEENREPFEKVADQRVSVGGKWTECFVPFKSRYEFPAGKAQVCLRLGYDRQTIELGGIEVLNFGTKVKLEDLPRTKITYVGREANAAWRKEALDRIEQIRKGDLTITVTDAPGKPIPGAKVEANLKRHDFGFGTCVTAELLTADTPDAKRYREIIEKYFNLAVFENDMKWPAVYDGVPPRVDQALDWLLSRHFRVRGHNLVWPSWRNSPKQLEVYKSSPTELARITDKHITDTVAHFRGKLFEWDVVNEPFSNHDLMDVLGGNDVMVHWFKLAHEADPECRLVLNDYGIVEGGATNAHREHFFQTISSLKNNGAPIGGIGVQSHFSSDLPAPAQLISVLDRFATLGLPIESTEVSLNIDDPQLQADYMRDYMIAVFSHPKVEGIMLWGFWEKRHWRPPAALYAADWSIRPVGNAWVDLVDNQWKTRVQTQTDSAGKANLRGFFGEYDITVSTPDKNKATTIKLSRSGGNATIVID